MLKRDNKHRRRKWRLLHVGIRENFFHLAGLFFIIGKSKFVFYFILFIIFFFALPGNSGE